jgi:hypothetical protein
MSTPPSEQSELHAGPLPNRFTLTTARGCIGILGVLALPLALLLPLEDWHLSGWLTHLLGLALFGAMAGGVWLLARIPSSRGASPQDAWHPVTRAGQPPVVERPAGASNRAMLLAMVGLTAIAAAGYVAAGATRTVQAYGVGAAVVGGAGATGAALGVLIAADRMPVPAWTWARTPIHARARPQGIALALAGAAALGWALMAAQGAGYTWGRIGLAALLLASVIAGPLIQRWPYLMRGGRSSKLR